MEWFYVKNGEKVGPINDQEFKAKTAAGEITDDTLVWNQTMSDWASFGNLPKNDFTESQPSAPPVAKTEPASTTATEPGQSTCSLCGNAFAEDELIQFENTSICAGCKPQFVQQLKENAEISGVNVMRYAGFWRRWVAVFIDGLALYVVNLPIGIVMNILAKMMGSGEGSVATGFIIVLVYILQISLNAAYFIIMHGKYGATLGKKAMGIKVVRPDGRPISYGTAVGRYFAFMLSGLVLYIGFIMAGFDDQKRALHDHICNTRVVYK